MMSMLAIVHRLFHLSFAFVCTIIYPAWAFGGVAPSTYVVELICVLFSSMWHACMHYSSYFTLDQIITRDGG